MMWSNNQYYQKELEQNCCLNLAYEEFTDGGILITGAGGLIGSCLVDTFLKMNEMMNLNLRVTALCHSKSKAKRRFADYLDRSDFELIAGDISKQTSLLQSDFYGKWDYILHCAGNAHPKAFATQPVETMKANVLGTIHLLEAAVASEVQHPVKKMIFLSSGEVYGMSEPLSQQGWTEKEAGTVDSMNPRACYTEGKRAGETLCVSYAQEYGVPVVIARLSYIYGVTAQEENSRADVQFLNSAAAGGPIMMKSAGIQYRSYCYLQDAVAGLLFLMVKGQNGEVYNIANDKSNTTIKEFAEITAKIFGVTIQREQPDNIEQRGYSRMKQEILCADKLKALGWEAKRNLREGILQIAKMVGEQGEDTGKEIM